MRVAVITNTDNGKGLQRDCELLTRLLQAQGHVVTPVHFQRARTPGPGSFDLAIFLEVGGKRESRFYDCAPRRWLIPNPEWWNPADSLAPFERILCKTDDAERIFRQRPDGGDRVRFVGFESEARGAFVPGRKLGFLHVAGGSTCKGTQAILDAWAQHGIEHPLTVVAFVPGSFRWPRCSAIKAITSRVTDAQLAEMQRTIPVHLQPSEYEGFGHVIHEGLSVGACVVTTDAAPMRNVDGTADVVAVTRSWSLGSARMWGVSPAAVAETVRRVAARPPEWFDETGRSAVAAFEAQREAFRESFAREMMA